MTEITNNSTNKFLGSLQSYSGEPSSNIFNKILYPFVCHQSKTIVEQYNYGVHFFDFHIVWDNKFKKFKPCCGSWNTGKSLLQMMSALNKEVQLNKDKIYYILTLENPVNIDSANDTESTIEYLELLQNFNSISNSLNSFFTSLDMIAKRVTVKQSFLDKLLHGKKYKTIWTDKDNENIKYEYETHCHRFIPVFSYSIHKFYNNIKEKIKTNIYKLFKKKIDDTSFAKNNNIYIIKEFI